MSFKVKKWAEWRTVTLSDYDPGLHSLGGSTLTWAWPWQGRILSLCYDADDQPVYLFYDPSSDAIDGPYAGAPWGTHSETYGDSMAYFYWGNEYLIGWPQPVGPGVNQPAFFGWDAAGNFLDTDMTYPDIPDYTPFSGGNASWPGWNGSGPTIMGYQLYGQGGGGPYWEVIGYFSLGGGFTLLKSQPYVTADPDNIGVFFWEGSRLYQFAQRGPYYYWPFSTGTYLTGALYAQIPHEGISPLAIGDFGTVQYFDPTSRSFGPLPGGGAFCQAHLEDPDTGLQVGDSWWGDAGAPLSEIGQPWTSKWDYMQQLDGGFEINEGDLDGEDHEIATWVQAGIPSIGPNGWYVSVGDDNAGGISFTVYCLNPYQPGGLAPRGASLGKAALGWVGDYAVQQNLRLDHVLPFPDLRDPSSASRPPAEREGFLVGPDEIFTLRGSNITYLRGIKLELSGYPISSEDWLFPGMNPDGTVDGFWMMFGGSPSAIGFMPDPDFGMINPVGGYCGRFLGAPIENLQAGEFSPTHIVRADLTLSNTAFAEMLSGEYEVPRYNLTSNLNGSAFCFTASEHTFGAPPPWRAVVGQVTGTTWTTVVDFEEVGPPGLGETDWTVWSVTPIPPCAGLPTGGYLVGATLYFDPWDDWELSPGGRGATFMETGLGYVPALSGFDGPLQNDVHAPIYLSAWDGYSVHVNRSLYGPDALLVYDAEGHFVKCLNAAGDMHPPDGREVIVTEEGLPRLIYRIYRHGTYSDYAEGYGVYHAVVADQEIQAPLYAAYGLLSGSQLVPGPGTFQGFLDMYRIGDFEAKDSAWRWGVPGGLYLQGFLSPKDMWSPPSGCYLRQGRGGGGVTLLAPGPYNTHVGIRGVGRHASS